MKSQVPLLDPAVCRTRILEYNRERYRGFGTNVEIDARGYALFSSGISRERNQLIQQVLFVGEVYGGAQARFLPDGYKAESERITDKLMVDLEAYCSLLAASLPLLETIPSEQLLEHLLSPFDATKRWFVWGTKFLQFLRPDTFPIVDSRVKTLLGLDQTGSMGRRYQRAIRVIREVVNRNLDLLEELRIWDEQRCPSVLKVFDKVLYAQGAN